MVLEPTATENSEVAIYDASGRHRVDHAKVCERLGVQRLSTIHENSCRNRTQVGKINHQEGDPRRVVHWVLALLLHPVRGKQGFVVEQRT